MTVDCLQDCPELGWCCRNLLLKIKPYGLLRRAGRGVKGFDSWEQCELWLAAKGLGMFSVFREEKDGVFHFSCQWQLPNGRCGDYENRPELCRNYQAGSDPLCKLYGKVARPQSEKIPVVIMGAVLE